MRAECTRGYIYGRKGVFMPCSAVEIPFFQTWQAAGLMFFGSIVAIAFLAQIAHDWRRP